MVDFLRIYTENFDIFWKILHRIVNNSERFKKIVGIHHVRTLKKKCKNTEKKSKCPKRTRFGENWQKKSWFTFWTENRWIFEGKRGIEQYTNGLRPWWMNSINAIHLKIWAILSDPKKYENFVMAHKLPNEISPTAKRCQLTLI